MSYLKIIPVLLLSLQSGAQLPALLLTSEPERDGRERKGKEGGGGRGGWTPDVVRVLLKSDQLCSSVSFKLECI